LVRSARTASVIPRSAVATGPTVHLRPPHRRDQAELLSVARKNRSFHRPWVSAPQTSEAFSTWLQGAKAANRERLLVCLNADHAIVGYFGVGEIVRAALQSAYLGYWANRAYARQGLMKEGMGLLQRHVFTSLRLHRLEANIQPGNEASLAFAKAAGFQHEGFSPRYLKVAGRWRDHERWAITAERWRELRSS
jgi:ribosomal-protein-alanine N-acetyltransferase